MIKNQRLTFHTKSHSNSKPIFSLFYKFLILAILIVLTFEFLSYKTLIKNFKSDFNEHNFSNANILLISKDNLNPFKTIFLKRDLSDYFNEKLNEISINNETDKLNEISSIDVLNEIKRYLSYIDLNNDIFTKSDITYDNGVYLFNCKKFIQAYTIFSNIKSTDDNYASSIEYIKKCKENIINNVITESTDLCNNEYYSEALDLLDSVNYIVGDNENIIAKIEEIKMYESDFSYKDNYTEASSTITPKINSSNINTLSLSSNTKYLVQVDLSNQRTNIFKGSKNSWKILKTFTCSSGIEGEETPTGVYTIKEKGTWFFSSTYKQGGKYWVQFWEDYLFHSLPYSEDKKDIVDYTLGKPSSHGCIRLREVDSKWIYDNIPKGSKVIIQ